MSEACARIRDFLPWRVNRTLAGAELAEVERHLADCAGCRADLAGLSELAAALDAEALDAPAPHPSNLRRILARLDQADSASAEGPAPSRLAWLVRATPAPVRWALAASWVAVAGLAGSWLATAGPAPTPAMLAEFRTLSDAASTAPPGELRVVFDPALAEGELRALLHRISVRIVDGPSAFGVYTLARAGAEPGGPEGALAILRADPRVRFAEPIVPVAAAHAP